MLSESAAVEDALPQPWQSQSFPALQGLQPIQHRGTIFPAGNAPTSKNKHNSQLIEKDFNLLQCQWLISEISFVGHVQGVDFEFYGISDKGTQEHTRFQMAQKSGNNLMDWN